MKLDDTNILGKYHLIVSHLSIECAKCSRVMMTDECVTNLDKDKRIRCIEMSEMLMIDCGQIYDKDC